MYGSDGIHTRNLLGRGARLRCSISLHDEEESYEIIEPVGHHGGKQASLYQEQPAEVQPHDAGDDRIRRRSEMRQTEEDTGGEKRQVIRDQARETDLDHAAKQELLAETREAGQKRELGGRATSECRAKLVNHEVNQPA